MRKSIFLSFIRLKITNKNKYNMFRMYNIREPSNKITKEIFAIIIRAKKNIL